MRVGGGRKATPPPRTTRQGGEAAVGGCGTNHTTVPEEGTRRASPGGGTTGGATKGRRQAPPPPPTHLRPPKGGGCRKGGADSDPPSRGQSGKMGRRRGEGSGRTTRPCQREASAVQAPARGAPGERTQSGKGDDGGHAACPTPQQKDKCRATCQCLACDVRTPEEGQRGRPPLPTPNSDTHQGKGRGQGGDGEGTWGMTEAGSEPPPRGHRDRVGRQWNESAGRTTRPCPKGARAVQAPTGGPPGVQPQER